MKYIYSLIIRCALCFIPLSVFLLLFGQLTIQGSMIVLSYFEPQLVGNTMFVGGITFEFAEACIATLAYYLIFILVLLTKDITIKKRITSILVGWGLIYLINIIRIGTLGTIAIKYGIEMFNSLDIIIWSGVSGIIVAFVWITLVYALNTKSIPVYDDLKEVYRNSYFSKRS